jgi:hypothetical protein
VIVIIVTQIWKESYKQSGDSSLMTFSALSMARRSSFLTASDLFSALVICKWLACRSVLCRQVVLTVINKQITKAAMLVDTCAWPCSTAGMRNRERETHRRCLVRGRIIENWRPSSKCHTRTRICRTSLLLNRVCWHSMLLTKMTKCIKAIAPRLADFPFLLRHITMCFGKSRNV